MIQTVLTTLVEVIVPLSIPVAAGALLGRYKKLDTKPLLTLYLYFLSPAIILDTLATADISFDDVYKTLAFSLLNLFLLWGLATLIGKILKLAPPEAAGLTLISTFTNSVNYGLPLVLLAFGQLGLDKASVYVIAQMVIVNTIGVYFAARSQFSVRSAVKSVFSLPAIYAAILALLLRALGLHMPHELASGVAMAAGAYSPVVLAILGAQMVKVQAAHTERNVQLAFWTGLTVRLLLAPLLAALVLLALNITGTLFSVLLILASMPVAVNSVVLAERFGSSPSLVSRCIVWTTLASFLVLPVLIAAVGG
ncbi:AEC family transporter [Paenibacillus tritici]|uniref:AEC family transporter n=1 Tax=Paenibacillus tritici TaxID=1873425 RepID=A0ABX2DQV3_9BACL|nr:AEC family transporter [Paenibacillus tritici]NQX46383.1 AEC family transporter [Paenibacillus tritici]QUL54769.1 AEC family transporter [Paenibacillus tritici]